MSAVGIFLLAVLSVWDYPARQAQHDALRTAFVAATKRRDAAAMENASRAGVKLLPDDPTWRYNLACSLAQACSDRRGKLKPRNASGEKAALDALEKAIDLGFRDAEAIAGDRDFRAFAKHRRFLELLEYAKELATRPILSGPLACVTATGVYGQSVAIGEQNLSWDLEAGCFIAHLRLSGPNALTGNTGDLYVNRDGAHAALDCAAFPGITPVRFDAAARQRGQDLDLPNTLYPYPVFGNASRALVQGPYWRSLPRALVTTQAFRLKTMTRLYLSNQVWAFPAHADCPPVGTNGDVFASITPYCLVTAGRSWSDLPYLGAALAASAALPAATRAEAVRQGLLAPTLMTLIRKSLAGVPDETAYLSEKAHPTALPPNGLDLARLKASAAALTPTAIPPLAVISVSPADAAASPRQDGATRRAVASTEVPELTYATAFAWAYVLRSPERKRSFTVTAKGAGEYAFSVTHGTATGAKLERLGPDSARIMFERSRLTPTSRVDVAVFGRSAGTGWGAPSYVSFAVVDPSAPYSDPALVP